MRPRISIQRFACPSIGWLVRPLVLLIVHPKCKFLKSKNMMQPRPTHLKLHPILQNLYKQMLEPIPGLMFSSVERHALPALSDGFFWVYKKEWLDSFCKHLEQYDVTKLENTMQVLMKQLAAAFFRQYNMSLGQNLRNTVRKRCRNFRWVTLKAPLRGFHWGAAKLHSCG